MPFHAIIGGQRGDEGKGRFVDLVADQYDVIARGNGGANAGHTIVIPGKRPLALHQVPSGIAYAGKLNIIGNGVFVDPVRLQEEIAAIQAAGIQVTPENLAISYSAHIVFPHHKHLDELRETTGASQGSTKSGIAYVAADKYLREGYRLEMTNAADLLYDKALSGLQDCNSRLAEAKQRPQDELKAEAKAFIEAVTALKPHLTDTVHMLNQKLNHGALILGEGAQAFWLDINHGMYPAVTSSATTVSGLLDGLGIAPKHVDKVTVVAKAVKSHVGGGPLVTEIIDEQLAETIRGPRSSADSEYGATTKRPRRIGFPDLVELRTALEVNGADELVLSKLDHIPRYGDSLQVATAYRLHDAARTSAPSSAILLETCVPEYTPLKNWTEDISKIRNFDDLPAAAQDFVKFFESELQIPIGKIGVGPERDQVIFR